jgi:GNAT superfamily N-acetyltransferase
MPLPIIQPSSQPTPQTLLRLFRQTELNWARHLAQEQVLDMGTALFNPELPDVPGANFIMDAIVPQATPPADALAQAAAFYQDKATRLRGIIPNSSVDTAILRRSLASAGWRAHPRQVLRLSRRPAASLLPTPGTIRIIPTRASFRHARQLAEQFTAGDQQQTEAALLHLDDPHVDALLALRDGQAVAGISVLAMGDVGRIDQLYVAEPFRRQGLGRLMLSRALEICARALFKHVLVSCPPEAFAAQPLLAGVGFEPVGAMEEYLAPGRV